MCLDSVVPGTYLEREKVLVVELEEILLDICRADISHNTLKSFEYKSYYECDNIIINGSIPEP